MTTAEWFQVALKEAQELAAQHGETIYVLHSPIYARGYHEYDEGREHVVGSKAVMVTMFPRRFPGDRIVASVGLGEQPFYHTIEDALGALE